eukprot:COSAG06_NODE_313_length_17764_cov_4.287235_14_plen_81_part_00
MLGVSLCHQLRPTIVAPSQYSRILYMVCPAVQNFTSQTAILCSSYLTPVFFLKMRPEPNGILHFEVFARIFHPKIPPITR